MRRRKAHGQPRLVPLKRPHGQAGPPDPSHPRCPVTGKLKYRSQEKAEQRLAKLILNGPPNNHVVRSAAAGT